MRKIKTRSLWLKDGTNYSVDVTTALNNLNDGVFASGINVSSVQTGKTGLDNAAAYKHGTYSTALAYGTQTDHLILKSMHVTGAATGKYIMGDVNYITTSAASTGYIMVGYDYLSIGHNLGWSVARRSRVNVTATAKLGEIACVQGSMEVSAGTITSESASANISGLYGRLEIAAAATVSMQACAIYADASYVGANVVGETNGCKVYCGSGTYVDYGFNMHCISNNMTAAYNIEVSDHAVLPVGINFERTTAGSITQAFRFSAATVTPIVTNAADVAGTNTSHAIKLLIGTTQYYIPVYDTLSW